MERRTNRSILYFLLIIPLLLGSCDGKIVYVDSSAMADNSWELSELIGFSFLNNDTLVSTDVEFLIRTGPDYPYRNIFFFVTSSSPDGVSMTDTLEYYLADEKGNRYGKGTGNIMELELPYRQNVYFPQQGRYSFQIRHGMRIDNLPGIYDLGIRIVESEN